MAQWRDDLDAIQMGYQSVKFGAMTVVSFVMIVVGAIYVTVELAYVLSGRFEEVGNLFFAAFWLGGAVALRWLHQFLWANRKEKLFGILRLIEGKRPQSKPSLPCLPFSGGDFARGYILSEAALRKLDGVPIEGRRILVFAPGLPEIQIEAELRRDEAAPSTFRALPIARARPKQQAD